MNSLNLVYCTFKEYMFCTSVLIKHFDTFFSDLQHDMLYHMMTVQFYWTSVHRNERNLIYQWFISEKLTFWATDCRVGRLWETVSKAEWSITGGSGNKTNTRCPSTMTSHKLHFAITRAFHLPRINWNLINLQFLPRPGRKYFNLSMSKGNKS